MSETERQKEEKNARKWGKVIPSVFDGLCGDDEEQKILLSDLIRRLMDATGSSSPVDIIKAALEMFANVLHCSPDSAEKRRERIMALQARYTGEELAQLVRENSFALDAEIDTVKRAALLKEGKDYFDAGVIHYKK